jgi:hypothetical protein
MKTNQPSRPDRKRSSRTKAETPQRFVDVRFRVNASDEDAFAQARLRLSRMCQNSTVKQEIIETLSQIGLEVQDIEVLAG